MTPRWRKAVSGQRGTGLVGTLAGVAMFGMFLLLATGLLTHLYVTSTVTAVAFDAARSVAGAGMQSAATAQGAAVTTARGLLGEAGRDTVFDWSGSGDDVVRLRVDAPGPHLLPGPLLRALGLERVRRSVVVRTERFRESRR